jgi:hypothetical protein
MRRFNLEVVGQGNIYALAAESNIYDRIVTAQRNEEDIQNIKQKLAEGDPKYTYFQKDHKDVIWFGKCLVVPVDPEIRKTIFDEAHMSKFCIHPGSTKMYQDLKQNFWWSNMKVDIATYVVECNNCHRMKASHLKSAGVLQPLSIPMWKWDDISMDFIMGLPLTARKKDSIWVIMDRLTKTAHFIAVHTTYSVQQYAEIYMDQIVRLHGIPKTIIFDRGTQFVARFWEQLHECLGTKLIRSSSYHLQTGGQTKRINQILEDMLRASILHFDKSWDKCFPLAEFSYNYSYQASLKMVLFDALYGRRCHTPLNWSEAGERTLFGPNLVKDAEEKVQVIKENLKLAQMRQKSYHDKGTTPRHFEVGDYVYLEVSPTKGVQRFGVKGKLAPHYIGPYEVIEVCGPVAYRIQLPERFSAVHNVFHLTQLKKGMSVPENKVITEN